MTTWCIMATPKNSHPITVTHYILDQNGSPKPEKDLLKWSDWIVRTNLCIADDHVGNSLVHTEFLGVGITRRSPLWETTVHGGRLDKVTDRCGGNREQAQAMHANILRRVRSGYD